MSKPLGTKQATKDHNSRKNPHMAEAFAAKRHAKNAERPKQVWTDTGWARPSIIMQVIS
jgi:hypothetical protein